MIFFHDFYPRILSYLIGPIAPIFARSWNEIRARSVCKKGIKKKSTENNTKENNTKQIQFTSAEQNEKQHKKHRAQLYEMIKS